MSNFQNCSIKTVFFTDGILLNEAAHQWFVE